MHSGDDVKPVSVGIVGLGTVGGGAFNLLRENAAEISRRTGRDIRVSHIGVRRDKPGYDLSGTQVSQDIFAVVNDPAIDIVVEVIGGTTTAREVVMQSIANGKHVVTASMATRFSPLQNRRVSMLPSRRRLPAACPSSR